MLDLLVRGGRVLDGTGAPAHLADVAVASGRIVEVGRLTGARAAIEIDATGRYVTPGFIDAHVHADAAVLDPAMQEAALRQGVTTVVLGQDGLSFAPAGPATLDFVTRYFAAVNGAHPGLSSWRSLRSECAESPILSAVDPARSSVVGHRDSAHSSRGPGALRPPSSLVAPVAALLGPDVGAPGRVSVAGLLATYDLTTALNTAYLVPHGTVRHSVLGGARRAPTADELAAMLRLVEQGLDEGAAGLSTGLEYPPGLFASAAELAALCAPVAARGLPYVTHMRGYEDAAMVGMTEACAVARHSGAALHVSHLHGPADSLATIVDNARGGGLDVTFDSYPYLRGCTLLGMVALPPDLTPDADLDRALAALAEPGAWPRVAERTDPALWPRITLAHVPSAGLAWAEGARLVDAAARTGQHPAEFCVAVLLATGLDAGAVFDHPPTNSEESVRALLRHPAQLAGSDGIYVGGHPHPRGWGAFARLLGRHVRELGDWTWEQATVHLAARAARRFGLRDRGLLRRGMAADLVVLDPVEVADRASYSRPRRPAVGVRDVVVNGVPVLAGARPTGATPGRPLRPGGG